MAAIDKVLRNSGALLKVTFYVDGVATDADAGVTYSAVDEWGDTVASGSATDPVASDGEYEFVLTPQSDLKALTITWTGTFSGVVQSVVTRAEVVGNHLFSIKEARDFRPEGSTPVGLLNDGTKYPTSAIVETREEITELFEHLLGFAPVARAGFRTFDGSGEQWLYITPELNSITRVDENGTTLNLVDEELKVYRGGRLWRPGAAWAAEPRYYQIQYEYGWEHTPAPVVRAGLVMLHQLMIGSDVMDRVVTHTDETGTYRLSVPDMMRRRTTGIPYVDAILNNYRQDWIIV